MVLFAIVGFCGFKMGIQAVLVYYFVSAYAEEFLKIGASENATNKTDFYSSDILSFSLLLALGFSIVENVFYVGQQVFSLETTSLFSLVFGRGIFSSLIHIVSTGLIALLLYKLYQRVTLQQISPIKKIIRVIFCLLMGVALHLLYNYLLNFSQFWVYLVVVIGGYYLLSYILFLSDSLYRGEGSKSEKR
ncbi:MAG: PrsW family intramembrane metalloprotease [Candidatus Peribacteria bacterium]|nr:PrsW family intramembrane metalloprotease [Candidatus Peribacteria bacterium]